jgi:hypothetical protein
MRVRVAGAAAVHACFGLDVEPAAAGSSSGHTALLRECPNVRLYSWVNVPPSVIGVWRIGSLPN